MEEQEIFINYKKTDNYRSYHADGFFGGLTPKGFIYIEPFIDRGITPKTVKHKIDKNSMLSKDGEIIDALKGIVREIECGLIMDIDTAKSLYGFIGDKINEYNDIYKKK